MLKQENIIKGKVTSVIGILFLLATLAYFIYPMIFNNEFDLQVSVLFAGMFIALGLLYSPDDLFTRLKNLVGKK